MVNSVVGYESISQVGVFWYIPFVALSSVYRSSIAKVLEARRELYTIPQELKAWYHCHIIHLELEAPSVLGNIEYTLHHASKPNIKTKERSSRNSHLRASRNALLRLLGL